MSIAPPPTAATARRVADERPLRMPPLEQRTREWVVLTVIVALGAAVIGMWLQDTGAGALHSLGDELTAAGRLTGLLGTYLLLVQIVLMARVAPLERMIGMDRLARWHSRNGQYVIGLLVAHALAIVAGYALGDHVLVTTEAARVVLRYPDVLAATVSLGLLVAVAVTSARAARRRMSYHAWYFVHLYTYLAVLLAFAHQLATGDDFATHPGHRIFWVALHLTTVGVLLGFRVARPIRLSLRHNLRVARVTVEGPNVVSITVTGERLDELHAEPGQFFIWRFLSRAGWWQAHPFSLSAVPDGRTLRLTVKALGDHSANLARLERGTRVIIEGPFGVMTSARRKRRRVLLLAGGIGVAPLRTLFEALPADGDDLTFMYRATDEADLVLRRELEELATRRSAGLFYALGPRHQRPDPLAPAQLRSVVPDVADRDVFVCGPPQFVDYACRALAAAGVPPRHVHAERFEL